MERFGRATSHASAAVGATAVLLAAGALATGCGSGKSSQSTGTTTASSQPQRTVDTEKVEAGIQTSLSTASVKVTKATCPQNVPVQRDATFDCSVTLSNGGAGKVTVTQQGAAHYTYAFVPGSVQIPGSAVDAQLEKQLAAEGAPGATVQCPENIIVKVNSPVTCNVSGGGGKVGGTVTFAFSEANGSINTQSVKA